MVIDFAAAAILICCIIKGEKRGVIESFASAVDSATLEEKRRLLRTIVKKVV